MCPHQATGVEDDPDRLRAFGLVLAGDEIATARGGGPAEVAEVVAGTVFAKAFEFASEAALAQLTKLEVDAPGFGEKELLFFGGAEFGVDADGLDELRRGPARNKSKAGAVAKVECAGGDVASFAGIDGVTEGCSEVREDSEFARGWRLDELGGKVVGELAVEENRVLMGDTDFDFDRPAEGGSG